MEHVFLPECPLMRTVNFIIVVVTCSLCGGVWLGTGGGWEWGV